MSGHESASLASLFSARLGHSAMSATGPLLLYKRTCTRRHVMSQNINPSKNCQANSNENWACAVLYLRVSTVDQTTANQDCARSPAVSPRSVVSSGLGLDSTNATHFEA